MAIFDAEEPWMPPDFPSEQPSEEPQPAEPERRADTKSYERILLDEIERLTRQLDDSASQIMDLSTQLVKAKMAQNETHTYHHQVLKPHVSVELEKNSRSVRYLVHVHDATEEEAVAMAVRVTDSIKRAYGLDTPPIVE